MIEKKIIYITEAQLAQFKRNGSVEINSSLFSYTQGKGILSKERIDPEPGEPYGAIWVQNYNNLEKGESIPIQFYDGVSGFQEIWLKLDN